MEDEIIDSLNFSSNSEIIENNNATEVIQEQNSVFEHYLQSDPELLEQYKKDVENNENVSYVGSNELTEEDFLKTNFRDYEIFNELFPVLIQKLEEKFNMFPDKDEQELFDLVTVENPELDEKLIQVRSHLSLIASKRLILDLDYRQKYLGMVQEMANLEVEYRQRHEDLKDECSCDPDEEDYQHGLKVLLQDYKKARDEKLLIYNLDVMQAPGFKELNETLASMKSS